MIFILILMLNSKPLAEDTLSVSETPVTDGSFTFAIQPNSTQEYVIDFKPESSDAFTDINETAYLQLWLYFRYPGNDHALRNVSMYVIYNESRSYEIGDPFSIDGENENEIDVGYRAPAINELPTDILGTPQNYSTDDYFQIGAVTPRYPLIESENNTSDLDTAEKAKIILHNTENTIPENFTLYYAWKLYVVNSDAQIHDNARTPFVMGITVITLILAPLFQKLKKNIR